MGCTYRFIMPIFKQISHYAAENTPRSRWLLAGIFMLFCAIVCLSVFLNISVQKQLSDMRRASVEQVIEKISVQSGSVLKSGDTQRLQDLAEDAIEEGVFSTITFLDPQGKKIVQTQGAKEYGQGQLYVREVSYGQHFVGYLQARAVDKLPKIAPWHALAQLKITWGTLLLALIVVNSMMVVMLLYKWSKQRVM